MCETIFREMTPEEREQAIERLREKAMLDEGSMKDFARKEGIGMGRDEREAEIVANLRSAGFSEEQIRQILKL